MGMILGLLALSLVVFGGGILCGFFIFRGPPSISVTLPDGALAEPIESLQRTIYRFDHQLTQHVERMTQGVDELKETSSTTSELVKLIVANKKFEKQLTVFAADVRQAGCELGVVAQDGEHVDEAAPQSSAGVPTIQLTNDPAANKYRTELRHPFLCKQWVAPYSGVRAPELEEFFSVQCRDISSGGVSFFLDRTPAFQTIIIRLSALEEPRYLTAQIQRTEPSTNLKHGRYVVGCKFLGTLHRSALPAKLEQSIQRRELRMAAEEAAIA